MIYRTLLDFFFADGYTITDEESNGDQILSGAIEFRKNGIRAQIKGGVIDCIGGKNYADNFSLQWREFSSLQLDSSIGIPLSRRRLESAFGSIKLKDLNGKRILELGCGAGRFTEVLSSVGAKIVSIDLSEAVYSNQSQNASVNTLFFRCDINELPIDISCFDYILCLGVIQHTPEPEETYRNILRRLEVGQVFIFDHYLKTYKLAVNYHSKYFWRCFTKRISPPTLLKVVRGYVPLVVPIFEALSRVPFVGKKLWACLLIPLTPVPDEIIDTDTRRDWYILDTFDALSAMFDVPFSELEVRQVLDEFDLAQLELKNGANGLLGHVKK